MEGIGATRNGVQLIYSQLRTTIHYFSPSIQHYKNKVQEETQRWQKNKKESDIVGLEDTERKKGRRKEDKEERKRRRITRVNK